MSDSTPNDFEAGFVHRAEVKCWSCLGVGIVGGYPCGVCLGKGTNEAGCGGPVEVDRHYGLADCKTCQRLVPMDEVT